MRTRLSSKRERCSINERHSAGNRLPPPVFNGGWPRKPAQEAILWFERVAALRPALRGHGRRCVRHVRRMDLAGPASPSGAAVGTLGPLGTDRREDGFLGLLPPGGDLARPRAQRMAGDCRLRWLRGDRQRVAGRILVPGSAVAPFSDRSYARGQCLAWPQAALSLNFPREYQWESQNNYLLPIFLDLTSYLSMGKNVICVEIESRRPPAKMWLDGGIELFSGQRISLASGPEWRGKLFPLTVSIPTGGRPITTCSPGVQPCPSKRWRGTASHLRSADLHDCLSRFLDTTSVGQRPAVALVPNRVAVRRRPGRSLAADCSQPELRDLRQWPAGLYGAAIRCGPGNR